MNRTLLMAAGQVTRVTAIPARRCAPKLVTYAWTCHAIATAALNLLECHRFRCQRVLESGGCVSRRARTRLVAERGPDRIMGTAPCSHSLPTLFWRRRLVRLRRWFLGHRPLNRRPSMSCRSQVDGRPPPLGSLLVVAGLLGLKRLGDEHPRLETVLAGTDLAPRASARAEITETLEELGSRSL